MVPLSINIIIIINIHDCPTPGYITEGCLSEGDISPIGDVLHVP